ncbi:15088_t:CDS:1, partial [Dentiscutata erythropus]
NTIGSSKRYLNEANHVIFDEKLLKNINVYLNEVRTTVHGSVGPQNHIRKIIS